jgi:hypothetical protein
LRKRCPLYRHDQNRTSPGHIIVKTISIEDKERIMKVAREKNPITYKDKDIKIIADFSTESLKAGKARSEVFQTLKENNICSRILHPEKLSFKTEGETKLSMINRN